MEQMTLGSGSAPQSETSRKAAQFQQRSGKKPSDEIKVWRHLAESSEHGMTDDEIEVATDLRHQTASARRRGLVLKGLVRDSGRKRKTRTGCDATVWITAPAPRATYLAHGTLPDELGRRPKRAELSK